MYCLCRSTERTLLGTANKKNARVLLRNVCQTAKYSPQRFLHPDSIERRVHLQCQLKDAVAKERARLKS